MNLRFYFQIVKSVMMLGALIAPTMSYSVDFVVYGIYRDIDMGNPGEVPQKNYLMNMGSSSGLHEGSEVDVIRRVSTFNSLTQKIYQEMKFKIATLKVLHVEPNLAVATLKSLTPLKKIPIVDVKGVMIGDSVQLSE